MGLNHLQTDHPCAAYGPSCFRCRQRFWCVLFRTRPPPIPSPSKPRRA